MTETVPVAIRLRLGRQRTSSTDTPVDIDTGHLLDEVRDRTAEAVTPGWWCATTPGPTTSASSAFDPHRGFENLLRVVEDARLIHGLAVAQPSWWQPTCWTTPSKTARSTGMSPMRCERC